jgi:Cof subfamily protein (haloacid dehalogenase superfamily)
MIILDLDGTLLNDYKEVSEENVKAIERAYKEKGVISVIATGRPLSYATRVSSTYGNQFADYIIASNGAIIKNIKTNEYINKVTFSNEEVLKIRDIFLKESANYMMVSTEEKAITETLNGMSFEKLGIGKNQNKLEVKSIKGIIEENPNIDKFLCLIGGEEEKIAKIIKEVNALENIESSLMCSYIHKSNDNTFESKYVDIVKKGCTKKNAIIMLAEKLGIKQEEIIVVGDGGNDISMFECAGLKIAMSNAEEYLKEKADFITASNNDDGVAKAIDKFIFGI